MIYPSAAVPLNEAERLKAIQPYLHLPLRHQIFQAVVALTARAFVAPMAIMSIVEDTEVQYPGSVGIEIPARMARVDCICSAAVYTHDTTIFRDLQLNPCPWVSASAQAQTDFSFYAGTPLLTEHDFAIGTLCILDREEHPFPPADQHLLRTIARLAMHLLDLYRLNLAQPSVLIPGWSEIEQRLTTTAEALLPLSGPTQRAERERLVQELDHHIELICVQVSRTPTIRRQ